MNKYNELISKLKVDIPENTLSRIVLEMNKYYDKEFTSAIQKLQKKENKVFNTVNRGILRKYYYYGENYILDAIGVKEFDTISLKDENVEDAFNKTLERLEIYEKDKIINSIIKRYENFVNHNLINKNATKWLAYYQNKVKSESKYSFAAINISQIDLEKNNFNIDFIYKRIRKVYQNLENYRNFALIFDGELKDNNNNNITWKIIYKVGLYCENFRQYKEKYFPFKKEKSIDYLKQFIDSRIKCDNSRKLSADFYDTISYGSKFEDLFISNDCNIKFLIFKKISLDKRNVPCPSCFTTIQSGNSFPEIFLRSWECKNPDCPDRSKSGRGKRFDEYGTYRFFKVDEGDEDNLIGFDLYKKWKRDIFNSKNSLTEMLIRYYSWAGETIAFDESLKINEIYNRKVIKLDYFALEECDDAVENYENLPLIKLLSQINNNIKFKNGDRILKEDIIVWNGDSSTLLKNILPNQIGSSITSPPYYNAREYSQWPTLVHYLIDMMINAKTVFAALDDNGTYLYNIGDIVSEDNIYVNSNMSKKRLQLGFLSSAIFEIVGFSLNGNIIWDKGEVQSKRNSTINLNAGYVRCINCYEHVLIFQKKLTKDYFDHISSFSPVIKINCRGENTYKHTAPYPLEMIDLLRPFIIENKYVLDPFLGSGTTLVWCKNNNYKGLGIELNKEYYYLCLNNIGKER